MPRVLECSELETARLRSLFEEAQDLVREEMRDGPLTYLRRLEKEDHAFGDLLETLQTGLLLEPNIDAEHVLADLLRCMEADSGDREAVAHLLEQISEVQV